MSRVVYKTIDVRMYADARYRSLSAPQACGQHLWIWLLTGPATSIIPGVIVMGPGGICEHLGWDYEATRAALSEIIDQGMAIADLSAPLVFLPRAILHNLPPNPNVVTSWRSRWAEIPECELKAVLWDHLHQALLDHCAESICEAFCQACPKPEKIHFPGEFNGSANRSDNGSDNGSANRSPNQYTVNNNSNTNSKSLINRSSDRHRGLLEHGESPLVGSEQHLPVEEKSLGHAPSSDCASGLPPRAEEKQKLFNNGRAAESLRSRPVSRQQGLSTTDEVVFILRGGEEYRVPPGLINRMSSLYPAVDVNLEFRRMADWTAVNARKRKTRRGTEAFVRSWLSRSGQTTGGRRDGPSGSARPDRRQMARKIALKVYGAGAAEAGE